MTAVKLSLSLLVLAAALISTATATTFFDATTGACLRTPDSWIHDSEDAFGYVIRDPLAHKSVKIRIHPANPNFRSPEEALEKGLASINQKRGKRPGNPKEDLLYSKRVVTKSGLVGVLAAHGFRSFSPVPYICHYYFPERTGRIFCVCVYTNYDRKIADAYEKIILQKLSLSDSRKE